MDKSEKFWNRASGTYDREEEKDQPTYNKMIEKTKKYLKISDIVLDYGCGTGTIDIEIAGSVKKVLAIDISSGMVYLAKKKTGERKIGNIDYLQADIWDERLKIASFDVVTAFTVLHLVKDTPKVIKRIHALLKPGGLFISSTPCVGEKRLTGLFLSLAGKIGLIPDIRLLKSPELARLITDGKFNITESECLHRNTRQYFFAARKI